jgi:hypothetical protein
VLHASAEEIIAWAKTGVHPPKMPGYSGLNDSGGLQMLTEAGLMSCMSDPRKIKSYGGKDLTTAEKLKAMGRSKKKAPTMGGTPVMYLLTPLPKEAMDRAEKETFASVREYRLGHEDGFSFRFFSGVEASWRLFTDLEDPKRLEACAPTLTDGMEMAAAAEAMSFMDLATLLSNPSPAMINKKMRNMQKASEKLQNLPYIQMQRIVKSKSGRERTQIERTVMGGTKHAMQFQERCMQMDMAGIGLVDRTGLYERKLAKAAITADDNSANGSSISTNNMSIASSSTAFGTSVLFQAACSDPRLHHKLALTNPQEFVYAKVISLLQTNPTNPKSFYQAYEEYVKWSPEGCEGSKGLAPELWKRLYRHEWVVELWNLGGLALHGDGKARGRIRALGEMMNRLGEKVLPPDSYHDVI